MASQQVNSVRSDKGNARNQQTVFEVPQSVISLARFLRKSTVVGPPREEEYAPARRLPQCEPCSD